MNLLTINQDNELVLDVKSISILFVILLLTNMVTYFVFKKVPMGGFNTNQQELYLLSKAGIYVNDTYVFEEKVREVSNKLDIPPEWLMAVMYAESKFDASIINKKSGATGLIQWMPTTAKDFNITVKELRNLGHVGQLDYVYLYLDRVRKKYGAFKNLRDVYLGILYPKAIGQEYCYTLYEKPSKAYRQNIILDEDKDGLVTIRDVDVRLKRLYLKAYMASL